MHVRITFSLGLVALVATATAAPLPLPRPLTLEAALTYATSQNPALLHLKEQIHEQQGVVIELDAARLPTVNASGRYSHTDTSLLASPLYDDENWTVSLRARQQLYAGGGVQARARASREQLAAAKLAFSAAVNDTMLSVRSRFYDVLLAREQIAVQEEALRVLESEFIRAGQRRAVGTGSDFDVLRAEVAVANARPALIRARNAYRTTQDQLRTVLGAPDTNESPATDLDVQGVLEMSVQDIGLPEALKAARAGRPELLQQEHLIKAAEQGIAAARSGYLPSVSAVGGYEWMNAPVRGSTESRLEGWSAELQVNWSIFDGRATAGRVVQAKSRATQSRLAADERTLAVEVEVRQAHASFTEAVELLTSSDKVVAQAWESLRLAQAKFQAGTATQLDVLTAQAQLTLARSNLAQAQHDYAVALAALRRAMGFSGIS